MLLYPTAQQFAWEHVTRLNTSLASVSRHTAVLRDAGLIRSHRTGAAVLHSLTSLGSALMEAGHP